MSLIVAAEARAQAHVIFFSPAVSTPSAIACRSLTLPLSQVGDAVSIVAAVGLLMPVGQLLRLNIVGPLK